MILASTTSYPVDVVKTAYKWVNRAPAKAPQTVRNYLGVIAGSMVSVPGAKIKTRIEDYGEQLVQNERVDRIVREWVLGSSNVDDYAEVGWALRLRDRFGFPSASEAARQTGERWVLKQLQGVEVEEWRNIQHIPIDGDGVSHYDDGTLGRLGQIAAAAATLWLTPTANDKAWARHQGFHSTR